MDGQRFDAITRSLAVATSRRRVLRGLAAGAVGALAGAVGLRRAGAQGACAAHGRVCTYAGCCRAAGAACRCYANGHCRCVCPGATAFDAAAGACLCPGGVSCPGRNACSLGGPGGTTTADTLGVCCPAGQIPFACCPAPGPGVVGFTGCCTDGVDCPGDAGGPACQTGATAGTCVAPGGPPV